MNFEAGRDLKVLYHKVYDPTKKDKVIEICSNCNNEFERKIYSSSKICPKCKSKGIKEMMIFDCIICNKPNSFPKSISKTKRICNICKQKGHKPKEKTKTLKCYYCKEEFDGSIRLDNEFSVCEKCKVKGLKNPKAQMTGSLSSFERTNEYRDKLSKSQKELFKDHERKKEIIKQRKETYKEKTGYAHQMENPKVVEQVKKSRAKTEKIKKQTKYEKDLKDPNKITCMKCGARLKMITVQHLQKCSGISLDEYKIKFPYSPIIHENLKEYRVNNCKDLINSTKVVKCSKCGKDINTISNNPWIDKILCDECSKGEIFEGETYLENEDKVVCQICFQAFDQITDTHLKLHDITMKEYREKFPDVKVTNNKLLDIRSEIGKNIEWTDELREKCSIIHRLTLEQHKIKHPLFCKVEELKEENGKLLVHCKYNNCPNSKENGGWFEPSLSQICERVRCVESGKDTSSFYCSEDCKQSCDLYRKTPEQLIRQDMIRAGLIEDPWYTSSEYYIWRDKIFELDNKICQWCGKDATIAHHILPRKTHPELALDPENGISCCHECHMKYGHRDPECSLGHLSRLVCERIYKIKNKK